MDGAERRTNTAISEIDIQERIVCAHGEDWEFITDLIYEADRKKLEALPPENIFTVRENDSLRILRDRLSDSKKQFEKAKKSREFVSLELVPFEYEMIMELLESVLSGKNEIASVKAQRAIEEIEKSYGFHDRFLERLRRDEQRRAML